MSPDRLHGGNRRAFFGDRNLEVRISDPGDARRQKKDPGAGSRGSHDREGRAVQRTILGTT